MAQVPRNGEKCRQGLDGQAKGANGIDQGEDEAGRFGQEGNGGSV